MPKQRARPMVVIIYTPHVNDQAMMTGVSRKGQEWRYSSWQHIYEEDVPTFITDYFADYTVIDVRQQADEQRPGMSAATPIILIRPGVAIKQAVEAARNLHLAIIES